MTLAKIVLLAALSAATSVHALENVDINTSLSAGYRMDELTWSIATSGIDVLSELSWDDIEIYQLSGHADMTIHFDSQEASQLYTELDINYGKIKDGENRDSDYASSGKNNEFSRSYSDTEDSHVRDYSIGFGLPIPLAETDYFNLTLTPLIGYSYHAQHIDDTDVRGVIPSSSFTAGDVTSYDTEWEGPWAGVHIQDTTADRILAFRFQYHDYDYDAVADWKLRTDFQHPKSFTHKANGNGYTIKLSYSKFLTNQLTLDVAIDYKYFETDAGKDKTFFADGTTSTIKLNEVEWESYAVNVGATYRL
ncbi:hypothetical protein [Spartinivicinus ruber]|uniref:hypothetical protein n=1 Tax=Spartinivicinus ruber TaxID=2683272 RepID=UPI0013D87DE5|nr:hypothetical protein [Spartinivicinus ruber]